ncbi:MAG: electron transfer flavoprotein subunit alpha/FixB family protein [Thermoproteota archaeon]|jgi:electron transfer flavoprotein alpha subunit|nr:electron transfer flavoprotein subunit alpha/FixB family protein [Thermoproteota archaeon]
MSSSIIVFSDEPKRVIYPLSFAYLLKSKLGQNLVAITLDSEIKDEIINKGVDELILIKKKALLDQYEAILKNEVTNKNFKYIIGSSSSNDNDIISRIAAHLNLPMFTDVYQIDIEEENLILTRKVFGGKAISKISINKKESIALTVSSKKLDIELKSETKIRYIEELPASNIKFEKVEKKALSGVDISQAEIVIGVGRGFKQKEDLKLAEELASLINAQIGSSRPVAADYKWLPEDRWIGISGKIIKPNLYFAIGISGAPQHIGGIQDSKIIVALDKEKSAPIFNYADYCIVADLYQFLPILIKKIKERKTK